MLPIEDDRKGTAGDGNMAAVRGRAGNDETELEWTTIPSDHYSRSDHAQLVAVIGIMGTAPVGRTLPGVPTGGESSHRPALEGRYQ